MYFFPAQNTLTVQDVILYMLLSHENKQVSYELCGLV